MVGLRTLKIDYGVSTRGSSNTGKKKRHMEGVDVEFEGTNTGKKFVNHLRGITAKNFKRQLNAQEIDLVDEIVGKFVMKRSSLENSIARGVLNRWRKGGPKDHYTTRALKNYEESFDECCEIVDKLFQALTFIGFPVKLIPIYRKRGVQTSHGFWLDRLRGSNAVLTKTVRFSIQRF